MPTKKELEQQVQEYRNEIGRLCLKNRELTRHAADLTATKEFLNGRLDASERARVTAELAAMRVPELEALAEIRKQEIIQLRSELEFQAVIGTASADFFEHLGTLMGEMRRQIHSAREQGAT
jgi:hypothetical protein